MIPEVYVLVIENKKLSIKEVGSVFISKKEAEKYCESLNGKDKDFFATIQAKNILDWENMSQEEKFELGFKI